MGSPGFFVKFYADDAEDAKRSINRADHADRNAGRFKNHGVKIKVGDQDGGAGRAKQHFENKRPAAQDLFQDQF